MFQVPVSCCLPTYLNVVLLPTHLHGVLVPTFLDVVLVPTYLHVDLVPKRRLRIVICRVVAILACSSSSSNDGGLTGGDVSIVSYV